MRGDVDCEYTTVRMAKLLEVDTYSKLIQQLPGDFFWRWKGSSANNLTRWPIGYAEDHSAAPFIRQGDTVFA